MEATISQIRHRRQLTGTVSVVCQDSTKKWTAKLDKSYRMHLSVNYYPYMHLQEVDFKQNDLIILAISDRKQLFYIMDVKKRFDGTILVIMDNPEIDVIREALKAEANDYLFNPKNEAELVAKVEHYLDRLGKKQPNCDGESLVFNSLNKTVEVDGHVIQFTLNEYEVCELLAKNRKITFSKERIYCNLYSLEADAQLRTITEYVYTVRRKFGVLDINPIKTVYKIGYKWVCNKRMVFV